MKNQIFFKILFNVGFLFLITKAFSQEYTEQFKFSDDLIVKIKISPEGETGTKVEIEKIDDNSKKTDFTVTKLKLNDFVDIFEYKFKSLFQKTFDGLNDSEKSKSEDKLRDQARTLFFNYGFEKLLFDEDEAPTIGTLKIEKEITLWKGQNNSKDPTTCGKVTIEDVEIEFLDGFIETIKVTGKTTMELDCNMKNDDNGGADGNKGNTDEDKNKGNEERDPDNKNDKNETKADTIEYLFENKYGIGFSTRKNFNILSNTAIFDAYHRENYHIKLGDLFKYDYKVRPETKDYSPKNGVVYSFGGKSIELKKDLNRKLFDFIIYSDFMGFNEENPNGLVQVEFQKKIPTNTIRHQIFQRGYGLFQYIQPTFLLSKIEENNRYLEFDNIDTSKQFNQTIDSLGIMLYSSPIEILNYQRLTVGLDVNVFFFDNSQGKYHAQIDASINYGRTLVRDSIKEINNQGEIINTGLTNEFGIGYFTFGPNVNLRFYPEERFGLSLSWQPRYFVPAFSSPDLIAYDTNGEQDTNYKWWIFTYEMEGFWKPSDLNGKVFVRWRFNNQAGNLTKNYHQLQTGISFYITRSNQNQ